MSDFKGLTRTSSNNEVLRMIRGHSHINIQRGTAHAGAPYFHSRLGVKRDRKHPTTIDRVRKPALGHKISIFLPNLGKARAYKRCLHEEAKSKEQAHTAVVDYWVLDAAVLWRFGTPRIHQEGGATNEAMCIRINLLHPRYYQQIFTTPKTCQSLGYPLRLLVFSHPPLGDVPPKCDDTETER